MNANSSASENSNASLTSTSGRYSHIDALRAFAVMLVVVAHAGLGHIVPGGSGVTIFFAISGFIITHLVLNEQERTNEFNLGAFYLRRLLKIAPPFLVIVAVPTIIYAFRHPIHWPDFFTQTFFLYNWTVISGDQQVLPGSGVLWSLAIEEQFYIVFALLWLLAVRSRRRLALLAGASIAVACTSLFLRLHIASMDDAHDRIYYGTDTRAEGIAIGVVAAIVYSVVSGKPSSFLPRRILASDWIVVVAVMAYLFSLVYRDEFFRDTFRYSIQAFSATLIVLYGLLQTNSRLRRFLQSIFNIRAIQVIGLSSYSIYLAHLSLNHLLGDIVSGLPKPFVVVVLIAAGASTGILIWWLIEKPVDGFKKRLAASRSGSAGE